MRYVYWVRKRRQRLLALVVIVALYTILLSIRASNTLAHADFTTVSLPWLYFSFIAFTGLIFIATTSLIWLYAQPRKLAYLLSGFSCATMFALLSGTESGTDPLYRLMSDAGSILAVPLLSGALQLFPYEGSAVDFPVKQDKHAEKERFSLLFNSLLHRYLQLQIILACVLLALTISKYIHILQNEDLFKMLSSFYYLIGIIVILTLLIERYYFSPSLRGRQQIRLFVGGTVITTMPLLLFTILPQTIGLQIDNSQVTTLSFLLFPLSLGYSLLRNQLLTFDKNVRRAADITVSIVSLVGVTYSVIFISNLMVSRQHISVLIFSICTIAIASPLLFWFTQNVIDRAILHEVSDAISSIQRFHIPDDRTLSVAEIGDLLCTLASEVLATPTACLFVLDDNTGCYHPYPTPLSAEHEALLEQVAPLLMPVKKDGWYVLPQHMRQIQNTSGWLNRPILASEVQRIQPASWPSDKPIFVIRKLHEPLFAPITVQRRFIGLLLLGGRADQQNYAGPDIEVVRTLVTRFSLPLETSRLHARTTRHTTMLNHLYAADGLMGQPLASLEEAANRYVRLAAETTESRADIWLSSPQREHLLFTATAGEGPALSSAKRLPATHSYVWSYAFYEGRNATSRSGALSSPFSDYHAAPFAASGIPEPDFPCAWLPLYNGEKYLGVLTLTFPRPHIFQEEEQSTLELFAHQCAIALENVRITLALQAAYEQQLVLDQQKDQFVVIASHELRTPLTAVQGYIELLGAYQETLEPELREEFIAKAHRGCEELELLINKIQQVSQLNTKTEQIQLEVLSLAEELQNTLNILDSLLIREGRIVDIVVAQDLFVIAHRLSLHQVLLNLLSNALKYSPEGSKIVIVALSSTDQVTLQVRDYGLGIPPEQQSQLFERFVRLERDMNSPIRGSGLGLYISKQLVEAMRGEIFVESSGNVGEGSCFSFTLQRAPTQQLIGQR